MNDYWWWIGIDGGSNQKKCGWYHYYSTHQVVTTVSVLRVTQQRERANQFEHSPNIPLSSLNRVMIRVLSLSLPFLLLQLFTNKSQCWVCPKMVYPPKIAVPIVIMALVAWWKTYSRWWSATSCEQFSTTAWLSHKKSAECPQVRLDHVPLLDGLERKGLRWAGYCRLMMADWWLMINDDATCIYLMSHV